MPSTARTTTPPAKRLQALLLAGALLAAATARAGQITIAAAADLKYAMDEIVADFRRLHPGDDVAVTYGSSGKFSTQIRQGAPYDLYFSADIALPRALDAAGFAANRATTYAYGRIVIWSASRDARRMTLASLADPTITRIAIANPQHAPYGKRAEEALRASKLWDRVEPKLVYGENVAQTVQFVQTGNAQVGIIALALAVSPELAGRGGYWLIPQELHTPLEQGFIVTRHAEASVLARQFAEFMSSEPARSAMIRYGFVLPDAAPGGQARP